MCKCTPLRLLKNALFPLCFLQMYKTYLWLTNTWSRSVSSTQMHVVINSALNHMTYNCYFTCHIWFLDYYVIACFYIHVCFKHNAKSTMLIKIPDFFFRYKVFIIIFTFLCYTSYHLSRKPISVVKVNKYNLFLW